METKQITIIIPAGIADWDSPIKNIITFAEHLFVGFNVSVFDHRLYLSDSDLEN